MSDSLAQVIISARKRRGLSQEELAEAAQLNLRTVQRVEKGTHTPRGFTLQRLAAALRVEVEDLTGLRAHQMPSVTDELVSSASPVEQTAYAAGDASALTVLYLSAFSYLLLPGANVVLPLILWRQDRHRADVAEQGRVLLNFEILWTLFTFGGFALLLAAQFLLPTYSELGVIWAPVVFLFSLYAVHGVLLVVALWLGRKGQIILRRLGLRFF